MSGHPPPDLPSTVLRSNRLAAAEFLRSGKLPRLSVKQHHGTGGHSISWMGDDGEDGMRRTVREPLVAVRRRL
ncbi:MAG: hypothetical protein KF712_00190 [Akkermansiaceae bacterium]|nr:hypothetical protein [Akkermansiaceae bacterium]